MRKEAVFLTPEQIDSVAWTPFPGSPGLWERELARDTESGSYTRLIKAEPGYASTEPVAHDFWEESFIVEGAFIENGTAFGAGTFVCNPPGFSHGPYTSEDGWIALEWVYYDD